MIIKFYSPSYKRAGKTKIHKWCKDVVMCVHEFEAEEYRKYHQNIMIIPDSKRGNMAKVRNHILDNSDCDICVMVDDDNIGIGYYEESTKYKLEFDDLIEKIKEWGSQAKDFGTVLFGINLQSDPKFYREYSPLSLLSVVLGPFCCIIKENNKIRYDERLGLNEDYDYALQVLKEYHKILRWNKYHYTAGHLGDDGGCGAYRTMDREIEQSKIMIRKWGDKVKYDFDKSTNPVVRCGLKGI